MTVKIGKASFGAYPAFINDQTLWLNAAIKAVKKHNVPLPPIHPKEIVFGYGFHHLLKFYSSPETIEVLCSFLEALNQNYYVPSTKPKQEKWKRIEYLNSLIKKKICRKYSGRRK